jgi:hypothetical protein
MFNFEQPAAEGFSRLRGVMHPKREPVFDIECPVCHSATATLAYEQQWCFVCPECQHVWDTYPSATASRENPISLTQRRQRRWSGRAPTDDASSEPTD